MFELCPGRKVGHGHPVFVIAEIGQNHQGDIELAKELIRGAKKAGADCVKLQKSCLEEKFTKSVLKRPYGSKNSFGKTYGEHKAFLEFSSAQYQELKEFAESEVNIPLTASAMDLKSIDFLVRDLNVPFVKIGSGDSNNPMMFEHLAQAPNINLVVSTGMSDMNNVKNIYQILTSSGREGLRNFSFLHCTSCYPTSDPDVNLNVITTYRREFPDVVIGYSGHELGYVPTLGAVSLGAKIIERHITLDNSMKGSDHKCSLDVNEFRMMVSDIRRMESCLGSQEKRFLPCEMPCFDKLGKSIVTTKELFCGHVISPSDLTIKVSDPKGCDPWILKRKVVGRRIKVPKIEQDSPIRLDDLEDEK